MNHPSTNPPSSGGPPSASASARAALRNSVVAAFNGPSLLQPFSESRFARLPAVPLATTVATCRNVRLFCVLASCLPVHLLIMAGSFA